MEWSDLHEVEAVGVVNGDFGQLVGVLLQLVPQLTDHILDAGVPVSVVPPNEAPLTHRLIAVAAVDGQWTSVAVRTATVLRIASWRDAARCCDGVIVVVVVLLVHRRRRTLLTDALITKKLSSHTDGHTHVGSAFYNCMTLTFDLLISGSVHAKSLR